MTQTLLSQDEIDALVMGGEPEPAPAAGETAADNIRPYNAATQHRVVKEHLNALAVINERFARGFRSALFNLIHRSPEIAVETVQYQSYAHFTLNMPNPSNLNMVAMKPLRGNALIVFPPALVYMVVDNLFGGDGKMITKSEGRDFTSTEHRIILLLLKEAIHCYQKAWEDVYPLDIEFVRSEMQPQFANPTNSSNEVVVNSTFRLEVGTLITQFNIAMPYSMIEPIRTQLNRPHEANPEEEQRWQDQMAAEIHEAEVEVQAKLVSVEMALGRYMALKAGDFIPMDIPETIRADVQGIPVFECEYGSYEGARALVVTKLMDHRDTLKLDLEQALRNV